MQKVTEDLESAQNLVRGKPLSIVRIFLSSCKIRQVGNYMIMPVALQKFQVPWESAITTEKVVAVIIANSNLLSQKSRLKRILL